MHDEESDRVEYDDLDGARGILVGMAIAAGMWAALWVAVWLGS